MKHFFSRVGRFFGSRGFLKFVLWMITIIVLFYVEEDWRGARAWAATKAEWEAKGETFDPKKFIPAPIPDEQNLAAIPAYKLEKVTSARGAPSLDDVALRKALENFSDSDFPPTSGWRKGESPDWEKIHEMLSMKYAKVFKGAPVPNEAVAQLDALFPFVADLRAAATRPYCRFQYDDTALMPAARGLGLITGQMKVTRILTIHALLELQDHRPDLALEDLKLIFRLADGVQQDSNLVATLVKMGMVAIGSGVVYEGLAQNLWNDEQLAGIDQLLKPINLLADYRYAMSAEAVDATGNIDYLKSATSSEMYGTLNGIADNSTMPFWNNIPFLWPRGWWDQAKCGVVTSVFNDLSTFDAPHLRILPDRIDKLQSQIEWKIRSGSYAPWNSLINLMGMLPNHVYSIAQGQVWVDETRIACALERYRLAHGVYPDSLEALMPEYIAELPHDVINGEPYNYRLKTDVSFLLYSVGGNQKDDGGTVVYEKNNPKRVEYEQGDWAWPMPLGAGKSP
jgi:hypothetical protein